MSAREAFWMGVQAGLFVLGILGTLALALGVLWVLLLAVTGAAR